MSHSGQPAVAEDGQVQNTKAAARRWPSDDPTELAAQLGLQLRRLDRPGEDDHLEDVLRLATAYLKHAQALAWRGVGRGDLDAPRALLDALLIAHPFLDAHLPELDLAARAAVEIHATFQSFYVAAEALEELAIEGLDAVADLQLQRRRISGGDGRDGDRPGHAHRAHLRG